MMWFGLVGHIRERARSPLAAVAASMVLACITGCGGTPFDDSGLRDFDGGADSGPPLQKVAAPEFDPVPADYTAPQTVAIRSATEGAAIYYTLDGTLPSRHSARYVAPISIGQTTTLEAIAVEDGLEDSDVQSGTYKIVIPPGVVAGVRFDPPGKDYDNDVPVSFASDTSGASICYTLDGTDPACDAAAQCTGGSRAATSGPSVSVTATKTQVRAVACKSGMMTSGVTYADYTLTAAKPVFSPDPGSPDASKQVSLSTATKGATIHYSLDGSTPDCNAGQTFAGAGTLSYFTSDTVISAVACKDGYAASEVVKASYAGTVCNGSFDVANAEQLRALSHCREITGSLTIDANDIADLAPLGALVKVDGDLAVASSGALTSLHGLEALTRIGGSFSVTNDPKLQRVGGFSALGEVGGDLTVQGNDALTVFDDMPAMSNFHGKVSFADNALLEKVDGFYRVTELAGLEVLRNPVLATFSAFSSVRVHGDVTLTRDPKLQYFPLPAVVDGTVTLGDGLPVLGFLSSPSAFGALTVTGDVSPYILDDFPYRTTVKGRLSILDTPIADLSSLKGLTSVGAVEIRRNPALTTIASSLNDYVGSNPAEIHITDNAALTDIDLGPISQISGDLEIARNAQLTKVMNLQYIESVHNITLSQNPKLQSDIFFYSLAHVTGDLRLYRNGPWSSPDWSKLTTIDGSLLVEEPDLRTVQPFSALASVGGDVEFKNCTFLGFAWGLYRLRSVGGHLEISGDTKITDLDVWKSLSMLGGSLTITGNTALPQCKADALVAQLQTAGYTGTVTTGNNDGSGTCN